MPLSFTSKLALCATTSEICAHPMHYFPAPAVCACRALPRGIRVPRIPRPGLAAARRGMVRGLHVPVRTAFGPNLVVWSK